VSLRVPRTTSAHDRTVVADTIDRQSPTGRSFWTRVRRHWQWFFHGVIAILGALLLWSHSVPGVIILLEAGVGLALLVMVVIWACWVVVAVIRRRRWRREFALAPAIGILIVALLAADVPLQVRWALSRGSFARTVSSLSSGPGADSYVDAPTRIGTYRITSVESVPGGFLFYEANGLLFDDAGFAYLPNGPSADLENTNFESPNFTHLGGPWYSWTASW
jgi:hypothetical protein